MLEHANCYCLHKYFVRCSMYFGFRECCNESNDTKSFLIKMSGLWANIFYVYCIFLSLSIEGLVRVELLVSQKCKVLSKRLLPRCCTIHPKPSTYSKTNILNISLLMLFQLCSMKGCVRSNHFPFTFSFQRSFVHVRA